MRKALVFVVVALFALGAFSAGVQAASDDDGKPTAASPSDNAREVKHISMPSVKPPACNPANAEKYIKCLDRYLTRLAQNLNEALADIAFYNNCIEFVYAFTLYGIPPTEGFVYRPPAPGVDFLFDAFSQTKDMTTDPFIWVPAFRDDPACVTVT